MADEELSNIGMWRRMKEKKRKLAELEQQKRAREEEEELRTHDPQVGLLLTDSNGVTDGNF